MVCRRFEYISSRHATLPEAPATVRNCVHGVRSNSKCEPMTSISITARDRKMLSWILLLMGALATASGLFGVWLQGSFYRGGFPTAATFGEIRSAFTWPTALTTLGSLIVAGVLFASPITASWPPRRRLVVFICFGLFVLVTCAICGHLATARVAYILN